MNHKLNQNSPIISPWWRALVCCVLDLRISFNVSDPSFAATRLRDSRKLETAPTFNLVYAAQSVTRGVFWTYSEEGGIMLSQCIWRMSNFKTSTLFLAARQNKILWTLKLKYPAAAAEEMIVKFYPAVTAGVRWCAWVNIIFCCQHWRLCVCMQLNCFPEIYGWFLALNDL